MVRSRQGVDAADRPHMIYGYVYVKIIVIGSGSEAQGLGDHLVSGDGKLGYWVYRGCAQPETPVFKQ
ncbi:hypothetical protein DIPPA_34799 [Diplonema papillatum]|nr:hypothetical protein DIPPA_34799 [Diplonema papillatum]